MFTRVSVNYVFSSNFIKSMNVFFFCYSHHAPKTWVRYSNTMRRTLITKHINSQSNLIVFKTRTKLSLY